MINMPRFGSMTIRIIVYRPQKYSYFFTIARQTDKFFVK